MATRALEELVELQVNGSEDSTNMYTGPMNPGGFGPGAAGGCGPAGPLQPFQGYGVGGVAPSPFNPGYGLQEQPGLIGKQPFQLGYDMPETGTQLHLHGPDQNNITYGTIMDYGRNTLKELNGYESSIAAGNADMLGFNKFP